MKSTTLYFLCFILLWSHLLMADEEYSYQDSVKSVFIYNLTKYITWPDAENDNPFNICILGTHPVSYPLENIAKKRKVYGRKIIIIRKNVTLTEIGPCHILLVPSSSEKLIPEIISKTADRKILTIGDNPLFGTKGIAINFFIADETVRFEINMEALKKTGLWASSQLLKIGKLVQ